jgi:hypothetical protein
MLLNALCKTLCRLLSRAVRNLSTWSIRKVCVILRVYYYFYWGSYGGYERVSDVGAWRGDAIAEEALCQMRSGSTSPERPMGLKLNWEGKVGSWIAERGDSGGKDQTLK